MTYPKDFEVREISSPETGGMEGAFPGRDNGARSLAQSTSENDLLAYLRRRRANALAIAGKTSPGDELHELALDRARQVQVISDDLSAGLHYGCAQVEADLCAAEAERAAKAAELAAELGLTPAELAGGSDA